MGVVKFLQASDVHDETPDLSRFKALRELANSLDIAASLYLGDFFEDTPLVEAIHREKQSAIERVMGTLPEDVRADYTALMVVQQHGVERLQQIMQDERQPAQTRAQVSSVLSRLENQDSIRRSYELVEGSVSTEIASVQEAAALELDERAASLDEILEGHNAPILGVRGNHDTDAVYAMNNIHFVEKGAVELGGLTFAAAPNTYEKMTQFFPKGAFSQLETDPVDSNCGSIKDGSVDPKKVVEFLQLYGSEKDVRDYVGAIEAGASPTGALKKLSTYDRLERQTEGKAPDILLTHKGPHKLATEGNNNYGSGLSLEVFLEEFRPSIILSGHIHGAGLFDDEHGYQGIRSSDRRVYVLEIDNESKKIVAIDIYCWADRKIEHKQAA